MVGVAVVFGGDAALVELGGGGLPGVSGGGRGGKGAVVGGTLEGAFKRGGRRGGV